MRKGDYRIIYSIKDDRLVIQVITVGHRKDIYQKFYP
ncbi:MAG: type II toxin-antitoxin system RelE family toxin [Chlorobium sp.]